MNYPYNPGPGFSAPFSVQFSRAKLTSAPKGTNEKYWGSENRTFSIFVIPIMIPEDIAPRERQPNHRYLEAFLVFVVFVI